MVRLALSTFKFANYYTQSALIIIVDHIPMMAPGCPAPIIYWHLKCVISPYSRYFLICPCAMIRGIGNRKLQWFDPYFAYVMDPHAACTCTPHVHALDLCICTAHSWRWGWCIVLFPMYRIRHLHSQAKAVNCVDGDKRYRINLLKEKLKQQFWQVQWTTNTLYQRENPNGCWRT